MRTKRVFIGIFGKRNQGKSSLINALAGQDIAVVSDIAGTTTDPVRKSIEVFGIGPVVFVDTAGIDDSGEVGDKRVKKTLETLNTIDVAVLLIAENKFGNEEENLIERLKYYNIPFIIAHNKADKQPLNGELKKRLLDYQAPIVECNTIDKKGIAELIDKIVMITPPSAYITCSLVGDFVSKEDIVVLVVPQNPETPTGKLLMPEVQIIRDIIDNNAIAITMRPDELEHYLQKQSPDLVITESHILETVSEIVPEEIPLTSFSIVYARAIGNFRGYLEGTPKLLDLVDGDKVLILESCSHISSCENIGRYKLTEMVRRFTGRELTFEYAPFLSPLPDLDGVSLVIQCGGCIATRKQVENRIKEIVEHGIPVSNYGMALAYIQGVFGRVTQMFK